MLKWCRCRQSGTGYHCGREALSIVMTEKSSDEDETPPHLRPLNLGEYPEKVSSRIQSASAMDADAYPEAQGMYRVVSGDNEYVVNLDSKEGGEWAVPPCNCHDFIFRTAEMGIDCKHALYVKRLVAEGYLPPVDVDPEPWMENELETVYEEILDVKQQTSDARTIMQCDAILTNIEKWIAEDVLKADLKAMRSYVESELADSDTDVAAV